MANWILYIDVAAFKAYISGKGPKKYVIEKKLILSTQATQRR